MKTIPSATTWTRKTTLSALAICAMAVTTALLWAFPRPAVAAPWILGAWALQALAAAVFVLLPHPIHLRSRFPSTLLAAQAILAGGVLVGYFGADGWLFYALLLTGVLLAVLARRLALALGTGVAVVVLHALATMGDVGPETGVFLLQASMILIVVGITGFLAERRADEESATHLLHEAIEISTLLAGALEADEVCERLTDLLSRLFRAGRVAVILTEPGAGTARVVAAVDRGRRVPELTIDLDRYPEIRTALTGREPVVISRPADHPWMAEVRSDLPGRARTSAILVTPILQAGEPRGVVLVRLEDARRGFTDREARFCRIMADASGRALLRAEQYAEVVEEARRDGLTGLYNVRVFHRRLAEEVQRSGRTGSSLSVMMVDLDFLKRINDTYGHLAGDRVIRESARILQEEVRAIDTVGRYGGEEFALLLPETSGERALAVAERLRERIEQAEHDGVNDPVTASIGIATCPEDATMSTDLLHKADLALYASKNRGRNRATRYAADDGRNGRAAGWGEIAATDGAGRAGSEADERIAWLRSSLRGVASGPEDPRRLDVVVGLASALLEKHPESLDQLPAIAMVSDLFLSRLPLSRDQRWAIHLACLLRDLGKLAIPDEILRKKGFLTREEYHAVRRHPVIGARILAPLAGFEQVAAIVRHHHERWDGKGYPEGSKGNEIPVGARVVGIVDAFQAMIRRRPYAERARGLRYACEEIRRNAGTQFDPELADRFLRVVEENRDILETLVAGDDAPLSGPRDEGIPAIHPGATHPPSRKASSR